MEGIFFFMIVYMIKKHVDVNNKEMLIRIHAQLFASDHDGYCSGNECELEIRDTYHVVDVPWTEDINTKDKSYWISFLPEPNINTDGSYFCSNSSKSKNMGLSVHDYKYVIQSVNLVESSPQRGSSPPQRVYQP